VSLPGKLAPFFPQRFDENEWFVCCTSCFLLLAIWCIQKYVRKLDKIEFVFVMLFNIFLAVLIDDLISMPPFDWYDTGDRPYPASDDVLLHWLIYPGWIFILIHFYRVFKPRHIWWGVYLLASALITTLLDAFSTRFHVITYKTWLPVYSFCFYAFVMFINVWSLSKVHRMLQNMSTKR
jgi:hypothetical protein